MAKENFKDSYYPNAASLPVSINYARVLLGSEAKNMSDKDIVSLIKCLDDLAKLLIDIHKVQISTQRA